MRLIPPRRSPQPGAKSIRITRLHATDPAQVDRRVGPSPRETPTSFAGFIAECGIPRISVGGHFGVPLCDLVAVAEHFRDERRRDLGHESAEGRISCAEEVDAEASDSGYQRVGVALLVTLRFRSLRIRILAKRRARRLCCVAASAAYCWIARGRAN